MDIKQTKRTLKGAAPRTSILLRGRHGLGKSEVVRQTAKEMSKVLKKSFGFIDIRLSQREVGDLIGMMRGMDSFTMTRTVYENGTLVKKDEVAKNVTVHDLPFWFPSDPDSCGFLFIDELDRASREVQQAAFELVLDYRMNFHELPIGWRVVSAINEDQDVYTVLGMDPALYDRFLVIDFRPTVPEWLDYAEQIDVHPAIVKYITKMGSDLDTPEKMEPSKVYPSRRSWVKLSDDIRHMASCGDDPFEDLDYLTLLASGRVGATTAINFVEYIRKDYKVYTGEQIINQFPKLKKDFEKMVVTDFTFYNGEVIKHIVEKKLKLTAKQQANVYAYLRCMPKEAAAGFWKDFVVQAQSEATRWYKIPEHGEYIYSIIGKEQALAS